VTLGLALDEDHVFGLLTQFIDRSVLTFDRKGNVVFAGI
jgi:hypothetical protein